MDSVSLAPLTPLLTPAQVADHLGVKEATLAEYRSRAKGPRYVRFGNTVRYRVPDIEAWLDACVVDAAA